MADIPLPNPGGDRSSSFGLRTMQRDLEETTRAQQSPPRPAGRVRSTPPSAPPSSLPVPPSPPAGEPPLPKTPAHPPNIPRAGGKPPVKPPVKPPPPPQPAGGPSHPPKEPPRGFGRAPQKILKTPEPLIKEHGPSKTAILIIILAVVGLFIAGGALWFFVFRTPPQETESPTPTETETPTPTPTLQPAPSPLVRVDRTNVRRTEPDEDLRETLSALAESSTERTLITHIAFAKDDGSYYSFSEFADRLGIRIPPALLDTLDDDRYTLIATRTELGPSVGLVIETADPDASLTRLADWEQTFEPDIEPLLISGPSGVPSFTDDVFEGVDFRFLYDVNRGIAYAVLDGKVVITTSRDLFRATISRLHTPPEPK